MKTSYKVVIVGGGAIWIQDAISTFAPDKNEVTSANGTIFQYDYLVDAEVK